MSTQPDPDPTVDPAVAAFDRELAAVFAEVKAAPKDGRDQNLLKNGQPRRYSTLAAVYEACREALARHNFAYPQFPSADEDAITIETHLRREGVAIVRTLRFPLRGGIQKGGQGFKPVTIQDVGKAITYARRYSLTAMLGIVSDEDDDGHQASNQKTDPLWEAYEAAREALAKARKITAGAAHRLAVDRAGVVLEEGKAETDDQVRAMTAAALDLTKPDTSPQVEASKAFAKWIDASKALVAWRIKDRTDAEGEPPPPTVIDQIRHDAVTTSERACRIKPGTFPTRGDGPAEMYRTAAEALQQDLERRKATQ